MNIGLNFRTHLRPQLSSLNTHNEILKKISQKMPYGLIAFWAFGCFRFVTFGWLFYHDRHMAIHYNDVIMSIMASQITSLAIVYSTVYSRRRSKKTSKLRVSGLCEGNSPMTDEFPTQRASNAENVSILMTSSWYINSFSRRIFKWIQTVKLGCCDIPLLSGDKYGHIWCIITMPFICFVTSQSCTCTIKVKTMISIWPLW